MKTLKVLPFGFVFAAIVLVCSGCSDSNYHHTNKNSYHYPVNKKHERVRMYKHSYYSTGNKPAAASGETARPAGLKRRR